MATAVEIAQKDKPIQMRFFSGKRGKLLIKTILLLITASGAIIFITPFAWMLSTAGKQGNLVWKVPPVWIPPTYQWSNYVDSWKMLQFPAFYMNTLTLVVLTVSGVVNSSSIAAFAFGATSRE